MSRSPDQPACRIAIVTCAVLEREMRHFADRAGGAVHLAVLEQGLHDEPDKLRAELQATVRRVETEQAVDAIVLGYGLCSRGIEGVHTTRAKLVVPRAHDCITLLLGCKDRYAQYVAEHPGTYWYSVGWNDRTLMPGQKRYDTLYAKYRDQFGEDNAAFLMESEQHWFTTYNRATFVDLTIGETDAAKRFTQQCADWLNWDYDEQQGDPVLIQDLIAGRWDEQRYCVLGPGQTVRMTADARVIEACDAQTD